MTGNIRSSQAPRLCELSCAIQCPYSSEKGRWIAQLSSQRQVIGLGLFLILFYKSFFVFSAHNPALINSQNKLKQLDNSIVKLKDTLSEAKDKHSILTNALADNEKKISLCIQELRSLQNDLNLKQTKIQQLKENIAVYNKKLQSQQNLLAEQIRLRFQMGEWSPWIWILNRETPDNLNRLLSLHQYFIQARKKMIAAIDADTKQLKDQRNLLGKAIQEQESSKTQLGEQQTLLQDNKTHHSELIRALDHDIQSKESALKEFERNKRKLAELVQNLSSQSRTSSPQASNHTRSGQKPPKPLAHFDGKPQRTGQGLRFSAKEGTSVQAVYPGKIVFSDWLNGYGLLLIIDHGQGLMTLYAHNQSLFKHKGDAVRQGEVIAQVGHSGGVRASGLYFEVRRNGKTVFPSEWIA